MNIKPRLPTIVIICQQCLASFCICPADLPAQCGSCRTIGRWRIALPDELTPRDKRFLRSIRVVSTNWTVSAPPADSS